MQECSITFFARILAEKTLCKVWTCGASLDFKGPSMQKKPGQNTQWQGRKSIHHHCGTRPLSLSPNPEFAERKKGMACTMSLRKPEKGPKGIHHRRRKGIHHRGPGPWKQGGFPRWWCTLFFFPQAEQKVNRIFWAEYPGREMFKRNYGEAEAQTTKLSCVLCRAENKAFINKETK